MSTPEPGSPADAPSGTASSRATIMPQRVLACVLCQKRKIKCDRQFPCAHCLKISAQCVQATSHPRQKHRRFPERELLGRLRRYEGLLRQNNISYEPLHTDDALDHASRTEDGRDADNDVDSPYSRHPVREDVLKEAWAHASKSKDNFLFGSRKANADLSTLHPLQAHIFRLWQIYLENVDPLLKITHTPTLQTRIIDAASDVTSIDPALEALMFGIYCTSVLSLVEDECRTLFASPKEDLLQSYQFGCEQALLKCEVLRTDDRNCLTALYLYLLSLRPGTDPRSVSSMLGVAIRIAQRLGIHTETMNARCTALEAEMRRRLWWALVTFDHRICELADSKTTMLDPTWNCKIPQSLNDFDIRPEMKSLPSSHETPTEALFAVMRGELGEFTRHSTFHLDFTNPSLKTIAKGNHGNLDLQNDELNVLETAIEAKYLRLCNPENPLHFMTIWTTRGYFARNRLLEHYLEHSRSADQQTDLQQGAAVSYALIMLECDTMIMTSPLTKGYIWYVHNYFPFLAYVYIVQDLKKQPVQEHTEKAWNAMNNNYDARFKDAVQGDNPLFKIFSGTVLEAWNAREAASRTLSKPLDQPRIVSDIKCKLAQLASNAQSSKVEQSGGVANTNIEDLSLPTPMDFDGFGSMGMPGFADWAPGAYLGLPGPATPNFNMAQPGWNTMPWNPMYAPGW
ncbi:hypothetical protein LTS15_010880 [Exophiala xenobiotica]|nr:hypothetical protein LTS15_010880 [Exophiala xenobiotica]